MSNNKKRRNRHQDGQRPQEAGQKQAAVGRKLSTSSGFEYTLAAKNLTDMRFLDALVTMQDESLSEPERTIATVRVIRMLLGEEQKDAFYAHITKKYGWPSPAVVGKELGEILANFDQSKKK